MKLLLFLKLLFILTIQVVYVNCLFEGKLHLDSNGKFKIAQVCYILLFIYIYVYSLLICIIVKTKN